MPSETQTQTLINTVQNRTSAKTQSMLDHIIREAGIDLTDRGIDLIITSGYFPETYVVKRG